MRTLILASVFCCLAQLASAQCNPTITTVGNTTFCQGGYVMLIGSQGDTYQWLLNGAPISGETDDTLYVTTAGSYSVEIDSSGCINTSPVEVITVNTVPPQPGPISGPSTTCYSSPQTFTISPVVGATAYIWYNVLADTTLIPSVTAKVWPSMGPTTIAVYAVNACGLSPQSSKSVTVNGRPWIYGHYPGERDVADMGAMICPGNQYILFAYAQASMEAINTSPYTYQWCLNGVPIPGETDYEFTITHGGDYSAQLITQDCGIVVLPKKVHQDVPNSITISPAGPLSFCSGYATPLTVTFDMTGVTDTIRWNWIVTGQNYYQNGNQFSILPDTTGYYSVWSNWAYYPYSNCKIASNAVHVTIPPPLTITQIDDTLFAPLGYNSYQWFESGVPLPGATTHRHTLTFDGFYTVEAVFSNGCVESSVTFDSDFLLPPPDEEGEPLSEQMNLYPNPVIGTFKLSAKVPSEDKVATINITDATGRSLYEKTVDVVDGMVSEEIDMGKDISTFCILKLRSKGSNKTASFYKKQ